MNHILVRLAQIWQTNGKVTLATGIGTQGQGHFTSFAQIVAEQIGVDVRDVEVITGDTDQFYWGAGTFASRGAVVAGNAANEAAKSVRQKILRVAAEHFECAEEDLVAPLPRRRSTHWVSRGRARQVRQVGALFAQALEDALELSSKGVERLRFL